MRYLGRVARPLVPRCEPLVPCEAKHAGVVSGTIAPDRRERDALAGHAPRHRRIKRHVGAAPQVRTPGTRSCRGNGAPPSRCTGSLECDAQASASSSMAQAEAVRAAIGQERHRLERLGRPHARRSPARDPRRCATARPVASTTATETRNTDSVSSPRVDSMRKSFIVTQDKAAQHTSAPSASRPRRRPFPSPPCPFTCAYCWRESSWQARTRPPWPPRLLRTFRWTIPGFPSSSISSPAATWPTRRRSCVRSSGRTRCAPWPPPTRPRRRRAADSFTQLREESTAPAAESWYEAGARAGVQACGSARAATRCTPRDGGGRARTARRR